MHRSIAFLAVAVLASSACERGPRSAAEPASEPSVFTGDFSALVAEPATLADLSERIVAGETTSAEIVRGYLERIAAVDDGGPTLNAIISVHPEAMREAEDNDGARAEGTRLSPLQGLPILLKDNIETLDPMPTTVGSLALKDYRSPHDAHVAARLRQAGALILGKANLSEWANFRSTNSTSGWSGAGGQTKNPHVLARNPCGSSSGSAAAVAAGLAPAAIGTETDGSIVCPAAANGIVGVKPTVGLVSRTGIAPISASQDTAGPMALTVADAAILLNAIAGSDPADPATAEADARKTDYVAALDAGALAGQRIGVARFLAGYHAGTDAVFEAALSKLKAAGAELVEIKEFPNRQAVGEAEWIVLKTEFKAGINAWLAATPPSQPIRTLDDLIAFNKANADTELRWFGQEIFEEAAAAPGLDDPAYLKAKADAKRLAGPEGLDRLLADHRIVALVAPTGGPAWTTDLVNGDRFLGSASGLPAVAGYPHVTVPMGAVEGLPVGLSFIGTAWSDARLLALAYAFEQAGPARLTPRFLADGH
jgi:amidase